MGDNHYSETPSRAKDRSDGGDDDGGRSDDVSFRLTIDTSAVGAEERYHMGEYAEHTSGNEPASRVLHGDQPRNNASAVRHRRGRGSAAASGSSTKRVQDEVLRTLRYLLEKQEREERLTRTVNEWRQIALIIDRALFWFFLVITAASSFCFLVVIPVQRRGL